MIYITTTATATLPVTNGIRITVNAGLTGTLTVTDAGSNVAIITNPAVGNSFIYYGFKGIPTVTSSGTCDVTVSILNRTE